MDEYWEACQLGSDRRAPLRATLLERLRTLELPLGKGEERRESELEARLEAADGYLCELKEAQIRLGLHTYEAFRLFPPASPSRW